MTAKQDGAFARVSNALTTGLGRHAAVVLVALVAGLAFLPQLGSSGLWDPWEMNRAHLAREVAGPTRVIVAEAEATAGDGAQASTGSLAAAIEARFGHAVTLLRAAPAPEAARPGDAPNAARRAFQDMVTRLESETVQLILVDLALLWGGPSDAAGADDAARELTRLVVANPAAVIGLDVSRCGKDGAAALRAVALGRAREAWATLQRYGLIAANAPAPADVLAKAAAAPPFALALPTFNGPADGLFDQTVRSALGQQRFQAHFKAGGETMAVPTLNPWLTALSFRAFGFSEFSARLPAAFWGVLGVVLLFVLLRRLFDPLVAALGALVLLATPLYALQGRAVVSDLSFTVLLMAGFGLYLLLLRDGLRWLRLVGFVAVAGLLFLAAGLFGLLTLWLVVVAALIAGPGRSRAALVPFAVLTVAFGVLTALTLLPSDFGFFSHFRFMHRLFEGGPGLEQRNFDYFVRQLGFGLFPWSALLPLAFVWPWVQTPDDASTKGPLAPREALLIGFGVPLALQMVALRQFSYCAFVAAPFAAAAVGYLLAELIRRPAADSASRPGERPLAGALAFLGFAVVALLAMQLKDSPEPLVSVLAYDPQFSTDGTGNLSFPEAVRMPAPLVLAGIGFALLLLVYGFSLGTALRTEVMGRFRRRGWMLAGLWSLAALWLIDVFVSVALKFDTALRLPAARSLQPAERLAMADAVGGPLVVLYYGVLAALALTALVFGTHWGARLRARLRPLLRPLVGAARLERWPTPVRRAPGLRFQAVAAVLVVGGAAFLLVRAAGVWSTYFDRLFPGQEDHYFANVLLHSRDVLLFYVLAAALVLNWLLREPLRRFAAPFRVGELFERPAVFAGGLIVLAGVFTAWVVLGLQPALAIHVSQKHIMETYYRAESRQELGDNIFKHGLFASQGRREVNFYTAGIPEIADRNQVIDILEGRRDIAVRAGSGQGGSAKYRVLRGFDPKNDRNGDGLRDWKADAGLLTAAGQAGGVAFAEDQTKQWTPDEWRGFALYDSTGQPAAVRGNTPNRLSVERAPAFAAAVPARNRYVVDDVNAVEHGASAMQRQRTYVVLPKRSFSELNYTFRKKNDGRHIPVLDASSSQFILAAGFLRAGESEQNWLAQHLMTEQQMRATPRFRPGFANFDDQLEFLGHAVEEDTVRRGKDVRIRMFFRCKTALSVSYKMFMHIDREGGSNRINGDHWPLNLAKSPGDDPEKTCNGCFQTRHWLPGDLYVDEFKTEVPLGTPSGKQDIWLGFFNPNDDKRLKVTNVDTATVTHDGQNRILIGSFSVN